VDRLAESTITEVVHAGADCSVYRAVTLHAYPATALERAWRKYTLREQYPTQYLAPEFFLEPFFADKKPFAILVTKHDEVVAVLTGLHEEKFVRCGNSGSPQMSVSPECEPEGLACLIEALRIESGKKGATITSFYDVAELKSFGFFYRTSGATMILDLQQGPDALYKQFSKGRRSDIQFALRSGVQVVEATSLEDFERYYQVYLDWCARKKLAHHSPTLMVRALQLRSNRKLFLATHDGKVVAGSIFRFLESGIGEYAANNSPEEYQSLRPNPLLNWTAIQWASKIGLKSLSMGGAHPYLRHFGGKEVPIYRYSLDLTFLKTFRLREWLISWRHASKKSANLKKH
jgi:hypothetical protein